MADLDDADWNLRSPELGQLRELDDRSGAAIVGMELAPPLDHSERDGWLPLRRTCRALPAHRNAIELVGLEGDRALLKFAAIDWRARPRPGDELATAIKLTHLFEHVLAAAASRNLVWFQRPKLLFDLRGEPRVMWLPVGSTSPDLAPEARSAWPHCSEKTLVYTLGGLLSKAGLAWNPKAAALVKRCLAPKSGQRIGKLKEIRVALQFLLPMDPPKPDLAWDLVEEGIGWLELDRPANARARFEAVLGLGPPGDWSSQLATAGIARANTATILSLAEVGTARRLESGRHWHEAIATYRRARRAMAPADYLLARARCACGLQQEDDALELATRAVAADPSHVEALQMVVKAALACWDTELARAACDKLATIAPRAALGSLLQVIDAAIVKGRFAEASSCAAMLGSLARSGTEPIHDVELLSGVAGRIASSGKPIDALAFCDQLYELSPDHGIQVFVALASRVATARLDDALAICERIHALSPAQGIIAFANVVEAIFLRGELAGALAVADRFVALAPGSAIAHYRHGRCLFGVRRLVEARAALERAQVLDPKLLEAMALRREVDRALAKVRAVVGTAASQQLAIPEHLTEVRQAMSRGSIDDAIAWLETHEIGDGAARLLLAQLLVGASRFADAVIAFDRVSAGALQHAACVGKARALAATGRGEEALRLLDRVCAEQPELTEAVVVRAKVVDLLRPDRATAPAR